MIGSEMQTRNFSRQGVSGSGTVIPGKKKKLMKRVTKESLRHFRFLRLVVAFHSFVS